MKKKLFLSTAAIVAVVVGVVGMSAFEAHIINVTAKIENALDVDTTSIDFGTVFPQELLHQNIDIGMSESFKEEGRVDDVEYTIKQKPKPRPEAIDSVFEGNELKARQWCHDFYNENDLFNSPYDPNDETWQEFLRDCYYSLCPYLSKHKVDIDDNDTELDAFHDPTTEVATGRLVKSETDLNDVWDIDLDVPCFEGMCAQDWTHEGWELPADLESQTFGCDLWVEVNGLSELPPEIQTFEFDLEDKDGDWNPIYGNNTYGIVTMDVHTNPAGMVDITVDAYGLEPNTDYQITLNGQPGDITPGGTGDLLAQSACDAGNQYCGGWWAGALPVHCGTGDPGDEGFYSYNLSNCADPSSIETTTDGSGYFTFTKTVTLRSGHYTGVKFLVKRNVSPWTTDLFEVAPFDFIIP